MDQAAMILAAGRGERMRPLTDRCPKPLLEAGGKPLIVHHIERCAAAGYRQIVINTHYLGEQIRQYLGDGARYNVDIRYSDEPGKALETGGGIFQALPLLTTEPFLVINGDIWTDHPLNLPDINASTLAHLVLVPNPPQHPAGDFAIDGKFASNAAENRYTFAGIGWYRAVLFRDQSAGCFPLAPLLRAAIEQQLISAEVHHGEWMDIGTVARLTQLRQRLGFNQSS